MAQAHLQALISSQGDQEAIHLSITEQEIAIAAAMQVVLPLTIKAISRAAFSDGAEPLYTAP